MAIPIIGRIMVSAGEIKALVDSEENFLRFEDLCNRLVSIIEGRPVLGTALGGDLGADGRAIQLDVLSGDLVVASSVRKDVVDKMAEDARRIRDTHTGGTVYFCSSRSLGEKAKADARKRLLEILGNEYVINLLSHDEVCDLALRNATVFQQLYSVDLQVLRSRLSAITSATGGTAQLQIAHALTSSDGFDNRDRVAEFLVTEVLSHSTCTPNEVAAGLQSVLRLPTAFPRDVIVAALRRLLDQGLVVHGDSERYELTDKGREVRSRRIAESRNESEVSKARFATEVEQRLGYTVSKAQQDKLWQHLMHEMCVLLVKIGSRFVALVETAKAKEDLNSVRTLASDSVRAACRSAVRTVKDARAREETEEALYQALLEKPEVALEWLEEVIGAWLAACQLGLIAEISNQLQPGLRRQVVALDTDIVLSLLCEAEPDNGPLTTTLAQWAEIGGRTLIAPEVLKEVAHHAWIARVEFHEIASIIRSHKYNPGLARSVARNAFVRAYWASGRNPSSADFDRFIRSYAGQRADDTSTVEVTIARLNIGKRVLPPTAQELAPFRHIEPKVRKVLSRAARFAPHDPAGGAIQQEKMDRDAAAIVRYAASANGDVRSIGMVLLLSSSKRLRLAVRQGAPSANVVVAASSTLGLLLAAAYAPQVKPQSIAQLLLAEGTREHVGYVRSELVRMIARSDLLGVLPPARIVSLERELDDAVLDYAKSSSRSRQEVRKDVLTAANRDVALQVLSTALRETALGAETDKLVREQAREISRLRGKTDQAVP